MTPECTINDTTVDIRTADYRLRWIYKLEPVIAAIALVLTFPVAIALAIAITVLSRRSPLIRHARVGWHGTPLGLLKFRTMWERRPAGKRTSLVEDIVDSTAVLKNSRDPRVTSRFAAICRRYSLDEIPQFYHVMCGKMSFVGPRPITRGELDKYYGPCAEEVLRLRPGMTGLWQVLGRSRLSYCRRRKLDLLLVRHSSPYLYFWILLRTIPKVVSGYDAC
jgi:exopolysaccharide production protein ExoY